MVSSNVLVSLFAALQRSQALAVEYGHAEVQQEHMMMALTEESGDLIPQLLGK